MSFVSRGNAVRGRCKSQIEVGQSIVVIYDNDGEDKTPPDAEHVHFTVLDGSAQQVSMGASKRFRYPGVAIAEISVPVGDGDGRARAIADYFTTAFRAQTVGGVTYRTPYPSHIGRVEGWFKLAVTCPFYADETT